MNNLCFILHRKKTSKGFTLIELLVVIAIIGIMSSVTLASLKTSAAKARDADRNSKIHNTIVALNLYYDQYGKFPCQRGDFSSDPNFLLPLVTKKYLPTTLRDPINKAQYVFEYNTYKNKPGGSCGAIAELSYDTEGAACSNGSISATPANPATHCHNFFPTPLPCNDPLWTHASGFTGDCVALQDQSSEDEY